MTDNSRVSPGDVAVKLDLICKLHGLEKAEKYLGSVPDAFKTFKVYGALLNCYAKRKLVEKAEAIMLMMKSSNCNLELSYNVMLDLYSKLGKREKLGNLYEEMEEKGINCGIGTLGILLNAYAGNSDIEPMEKIYMKIENYPQVNLNWNVCCIAAKGYLRAGLVDKASDMLKKAEKLIRGNKGVAYKFLLSMYASLGDKDEVNRIWHLCKKRGAAGNMGYFYMMCSLIRLDDIDGAENIFREWESVNSSYDFRIPNALLNAYTKRGLLPKARALVDGIVDSGKKIPESTWDLLATGYWRDGQMDEAVDAMKKAIIASEPEGRGWTLNRATIITCLEYLNRKGDAVKEFAKLLEERGIVLIRENGSSEINTFHKVEENDEGT